MHGTRTTAKVLVGMAVAALSGCVSVESPPPAPEQPREISRPTQDVAPQIVQGPAREALEAALPDPGPPAPRAGSGERKQSAGSGALKGGEPPASVPKQKRDKPAAKPPEPPAWPEPPHSRGDLCDLGERYGGWRPGSREAKICRGTHGH
ncbi:hypothetical protein ACWDX6_23735 [Streptomyces sp. NPDC003027]